jgi:hypothetical protein
LTIAVDPHRLNPHAFNLAKTHLIAAPVVEFGRFDVRVTRHPLGDVNVAAAFQIIRDTDGPERMIAYCRLDARIPGPSAHHVPCIDARHGPLGQLARPADGRGEERTFLVLGDPSRRDILIQILFKLMVAAHFVDLAALLFEAQPPSFLERKIILHLQTHHGGNPREGVDHDADKGSVAQAHRMRRIDLF